MHHTQTIAAAEPQNAQVAEVVPLSRASCSMRYNAGDAGEKTRHWSPTVTGKWSTDCATGRAYAENLLAEIRAGTTFPDQLGWIIHDMVAAGSDKFGGVERGFLQAIAEAVR
jgi:hypothetical protein